MSAGKRALLLVGLSAPAIAVLAVGAVLCRGQTGSGIAPEGPPVCLEPSALAAGGQCLSLVDGARARSAIARAIGAPACYAKPASADGASLLVVSGPRVGLRDLTIATFAPNGLSALRAAVVHIDPASTPGRAAFIGDRRLVWARSTAWVTGKGGAPVQCFDLETGEVVWSLAASAAYDAGHIERIVWGGRKNGGRLAVEAQAATESGWVRQVLVFDLDTGLPKVLRAFTTATGERSVWPGLAVAPGGDRVLFQDGDSLCEAGLPQGPVRVLGACTTSGSAAIPSADGRHWAEVDMGTRESLLCGVRVHSLGGVSGPAASAPVELEGTYEPYSVNWIDGTDLLLSAVAPSEAARGELVASSPDGRVRRIGPNGSTAPFDHGFWILRGGEGSRHLSRIRTDTWAEEPLILDVGL